MDLGQLLIIWVIIVAITFSVNIAIVNKLKGQHLLQLPLEECGLIKEQVYPPLAYFQEVQVNPWSAGHSFEDAKALTE